jgi:hypothetical protein
VPIIHRFLLNIAAINVTWLIATAAERSQFATMASTLPIPEPPRTPSPLSDNNSQEGNLPPMQQQYDPDALSPMPSFAQGQRAKGEDMAVPATPTSPTHGSHGSIGSGTVDSNPFNFQPMALAKTPIMKSVCLEYVSVNANACLTDWVRNRTSASDAVTNTNTAVYRIRSSWNHRLELP